MTQEKKQNSMVVVAALLVAVAVMAAFSQEAKNDEKANQINTEFVRVRVINSDGVLLFNSNCETKQESDGTFTIQATSDGDL